MHTREDLSCTRGYEFWLLKEAKSRNPNIKTYALSWGVPAWVGNGSFFSADNVFYQTQFITCVKDTLGFDIDYLGIWNERSAGNVDYVVSLRDSLDAAGFSGTQIIGCDGAGQEGNVISMAEGNSTYNASIAGVGSHYPCNRPIPAVQVCA
jgi:hypothetical protein